MASPSEVNVTMYSQNNEFWKTYMAGRPQVPASYLDRIFQYHTDHGGRFDTAHDVGAGGGVHSARLAERFNKVIVSDPSEQNIQAAQSHFSDSKFESHVAKLEDTATLLPPASIDLVFAGTMLHMCDVPRALEAVAHQLRPGGSLIVGCMGFYGLNDEAVNKAQLALFHTAVMQIVRKSNWNIIPAMFLNASSYDNVALPSEYFESDSVRWKINETILDAPGGSLATAMMAPEVKKNYLLECKIASTEKIVHERSEEWAFEKGFEDMMAYFRTFPFDMQEEDIKQKLAALKEVVEERKIPGEWVTYSILATWKQ